MPCYRPITAYRGDSGEVRFESIDSGRYSPFQLPCGSCVGCRLERARSWANRCVHESHMHDQSWFVTLTYDEKNIPEGHSLCKPDFQRFMRSLRKRAGARRVNPLTGRRKLYRRKVRFFACGEYGSRTLRPHYHALLFGLPLTDLVPWRTGEGGDRIYRSEFLSSVWNKGNVEVGSVTIRSAAYVAGYILKKNDTDIPDDIRYRRTDFETGETWEVIPEFHLMSLKPGIGVRFLEKYKQELVTHAGCIHQGGVLHKLPRHYRDVLTRTDLASAVIVEDKTITRADSCSPLDSTPARLAVRETVALAKLKLKKRSL